MTRHHHAAAVGLLCLAPLFAHADPMRPLGGGAGLKDVSNRPGTTGMAPAQPAPASGAMPSAPQPRLVAIRQDSHGNWHALFDERWLTTGDRLGTQRIAAIDAGAVQLREGRQTRTVHLLPVLEPTPTATAASGAPGTPARRGERTTRQPPPDIPTAAIARKTTP